MTKVYAVDQDRWATLSIFDQMGNIYSEVGRSFNAKSRNNTADRQAATKRAIELFDATASVLIAKKSPKSREVLIAKKQYLDIINSSDPTQESIMSLDRYFMQFAIAARLNR